MEAHVIEGGDEPTRQYLSHQQILTVIVGLMAGMLLAALDQSIVGTALPRIVSELGGLNQLSWVVTAYLLTSTAATPLWGKISDLYGRRIVFQIAIVIFLAGSILAGMSQNMGELIGFRALQGVGGGGLMSIAFAIIGDIIPPRDRGRYQGYFGAVFGLSSVAGPLLGGWFTDGPGWRWIFYINVPVGLAALVITSISLKLPVHRREHKIDYLGASVIVVGVSSLLLYLDWAGAQFGWFAPEALLLLALAVVCIVGFVIAERRAAEPIIPLHLFQNSIFTIGNIFGFLAGMAMFGAMIFLPLYLQAVKGMTPTQSGLGMLPVIVGMFGTSIGSGQLISRTGRYKIYPIIGAALLVVALGLLRTLQYDTPYPQLAVFMFVFGAGLGLTMQTITTAVQNAVAFRDLGTATSATTFFRQMGGAIGAAVFGAVLSMQLTSHLASAFGESAAQLNQSNINANNIEAIQALPEPVRIMVEQAFTAALSDVFRIGVPFVAVALLVSLFLKEVPLRSGRDPRPSVEAEAETSAREVLSAGV